MKYITLLFFALALVSCKNDKDSNATSNEETVENQSDGLVELKGEFVYYADAAVIEINEKMYGVIINDKMHELNRMAKPYKESPTDYVTVEVKGKLTEKPTNEEGWPYRLDIKEIVSVQKSEADKDDTITLEQ